MISVICRNSFCMMSVLCVLKTGRMERKISIARKSTSTTNVSYYPVSTLKGWLLRTSIFFAHAVTTCTMVVFFAGAYLEGRIKHGVNSKHWLHRMWRKDACFWWSVAHPFETRLKPTLKPDVTTAFFLKPEKIKRFIPPPIIKFFFFPVSRISP